jgi:hypothetical protein
VLRILSILDRRGGKLSIRDFFRSFGVFNWELEQAELLGWVKITTKKPATGRPSRVVAKVSNFQCAKLPLRRWDIPSEISIRHWNFVFAYLTGPKTCNAAAAYQACFHGGRSAAGVRASASRLLRHPDVKAALAWIRASMDSDFPASEKLITPKSAQEIQAIFVRLGHWRRWQL